MSLTNDMLKLKKAADQIASVKGRDISAPVSIAQKTEGSYYEKRTPDSNDAKVVLQEYGFATPVELKTELTSMWEKMGKADMCDFIPVSMVAAAKHNPKEGKQKVQPKISPFVYEF